VLSIAKLRVGAEAYELTGVAQSLDDYYSGSGEAAGWWAGRGAEHLGLAGEVGAEDLRAVLAGIDPRTGGLSPNGEEIRPHARRVPGFDLTFKAPKSVSVLYGVSDDPRVQGAIIEAGEAALRDTLAWLEREVMAVRRGSADQRYLANLAAQDPAAAAAKQLRKEQGADLVAAVFRHRTSRAGDPLLHWHVLVPNLVRGADGRWSAFVHPDLYRMARAAGEVFQAALRRELTEALGVGWRPGRHVAEVDGVPQSVCDAFSKRSTEIDAWLDANGRSQGRLDRQEAVLATRRGKAELEGERFDAAWKIEGSGLGFGPEEAEDLVLGMSGRSASSDEMWRLPEVSVGRDGGVDTHERVVTSEEWIADLLTHDVLDSDATFTTADVYQAVARRLGDGATIAMIDRIVARTLASSEVVPIIEPRRPGQVPRFTTQTMAATERRLLAAFASRDTSAPVDPSIVAATLDAHPQLGADQRSAVRTLADAADPVTVLIGPAGTGKTFTLSVLREALEGAGLNVVGAAPSARAAVELEAGASIESRTLHSLAHRWSKPGHGPDERTVLVIDEAAMASTVDLERLVTRTVAGGGRVVLVGDHHQLPEVGPGGGLAAAAANVRAVAELTENRRQIEPWERDALADLRAGSVAAAVVAYRDHGRVLITDDHHDLLTAAVDRYFAALDAGLRPVLMAGTNDAVARLNDAVRLRLAERGHLHLDDVVARSGGRRFVVGDRVVARRNGWMPQRHGADVRIRNGDTAVVVGASSDRGLLVHRDGDTAPVTLDAAYLRGGWVDHAYAVTAHRAQGGTWDHAIAVGVDGLYREAAYVQLSRGRHANWLVVPAAQMAEIDAELARHDRGLPLPGEEASETLDQVIERIETSRAKVLALSRDPHADRVADLADTFSLPELEARARRCRTVEQTATHCAGIDPQVLVRAVERAQHTAHHVALGQRVKAFDRNNVGVVIGIDDDHGTVDVHFVSHAGNEATRTLPWTEVQIVDGGLGAPRVLPAAAQSHLDDLTDACARTLERWHTHLARNGVELQEADSCERAIQVHLDRAARQLTAAPPAWLVEMIGLRPSAPLPARLWDEAVQTVARHRLRHEIPEHVPGLGPTPRASSGAVAMTDWAATSRQLLETRVELQPLATASADPVARRRSLPELHTRLEELDAILASAPADQRGLIDRLAAPDHAALFESASELAAALNAQGDRRTWILEHWPHVVEHAQVRQALDQGQPTPLRHAEGDEEGRQLKRTLSEREATAGLGRGAFDDIDLGR